MMPQRGDNPVLHENRWRNGEKASVTEDSERKGEKKISQEIAIIDSARS